MGETKQLKLKVEKPPVVPILCRTLVLASALIGAVFSASTAYAEGLDWIFVDDSIPILTCPEGLFTYGGRDDGNYCTLDIFNKGTSRDIVNNDPFLASSCTIPSNENDPIKCNIPEACDRVCDYKGGVCPDPSTIPPTTAFGQAPEICSISTPTGSSYLVECRHIELMPYCDSGYKVTPGGIVAIRGLIFGVALIVLIWFGAEFLLRSVDIDLRKEVALGRLRQKDSLPEVKAQLRSVVERRWAEQYEASKRETIGFEGGSTYGAESPRNYSGYNTPREGGGYNTPRSQHGSVQYRSALESRNPQRRFESSAWQRRLNQWKELRNKKSSVYKSKVLLRSIGLNLLFFCVLSSTMYLIIDISPPKLGAERTIVDTLVNDVSMWSIHSWLDALIFVDILLDVFMFILACCVVHWPRAPVFAKRMNEERIKHEIEEGRRSTEPGGGMNSHGTGSISLSMSLDSPRNNGVPALPIDDDDAFSLESVLKQTMTSDTCLLIACHQSTITEEKQAAFTHTLLSAMKVFPPSHIFVCDNGNSISPVDATQAVAQSIHPDINYLYIPEGNKTFAFYWCNRYWVPFLTQCGRVPDFKYALITDDDVPLPADLHIPHEYLRLHPEVKAVHFAITASTPDGQPPLLVRCQDIEYKMAAVHKYFQSTMSRALSCHGAIGLWERSTLDRVFYDHDTVFHGEDLYMGLALLRLRDDSRIISCPQTIVPTYAPDNWPMLFRQRVKSWELTSHKKTFTYLFEFINPASFCHAPSLVLKPYFLQELLTISLDWLRIFLLAGLILRDWLGLVLMTGVFTSILYIQVIILQFVYLRKRRDLRSTFGTVLMFPVYRLGGLLFRLCALCHNILIYSHERKSMKIGTREDEVRDVAPCPPHPDCDWFTVWVDTPQKTNAAN